MEAVILAWDPDQPVWSGSYAGAVRSVQASGILWQTWAFPAGLTPELDLDAWLLVVGSRSAMCGIGGHGTVARIGAPSAEATTTQVDIDFDLLLPHGDQLPLSRLVEELPHLGAVEKTVQPLDRSSARVVRRLWAEANPPQRGALDATPGALPSRAVRRGWSNRFEQDTDVRRTVLAHRGSVCHACGLDMEQRYGVLARDLVQVHHVTPLGLVDGDYEVDPLSDLVPLCASCHVVAHSRWPDPYSVREIRVMLRRSGFLSGTVLTDEQLEAQAAALRILGASTGDP